MLLFPKTVDSTKLSHNSLFTTVQIGFFQSTNITNSKCRIFCAFRFKSAPSSDGMKVTHSWQIGERSYLRSSAYLAI